MSKHILDILASFETRHARASIVMVRHVEELKKLIKLIPVTIEAGKAIDDVLENMTDIAEVMDGYKQDLLDFAEMHRSYIVEVDEALKETNK